MLSNLFKYSLSSVKIYQGNNCRKLLQIGTHTVCKAAVITLGPFGRNVAIDYEAGGGPKITKDGVTVAKNVIFKDRLVDIGAALIRKSAGLTNELAGDGTTTSILIASEIFRLGQSLIESGSNPNFIVRGIKEGLIHVLEFLQEIRLFSDSEQHIRNVALISSNYDKEISSIIYDAIKLMGQDGIVNIEQGARTTFIEATIGAQLTRGFVSEHLVNKGSIYSELQSPLILLSKQNINKIREIVPFLEYAQQQSQPLFIIAPDMSDEVISCLVFNHQKKILNTCAITIPGFGDHSKDLINDIIILVGGQPISQQTIKYEKQLDSEDNFYLGGALRIKTSASETYIYGPKGDSALVESHKHHLKQQLIQSQNVPASSILQERLSRLCGKSVTIYAGGSSQVEMDENRDRIIDCLNATKNALSQGILPGGGSALAHSTKILDSLKLDNEDEQNGINLLKKTLKQPLVYLMQSANINPTFYEKIVHETQNFNIGFDIKTGQYGDMIELGVIDSFTVTQQALVNGVNLGCLLISCEVAIIRDLDYQETPLSDYKKDAF